MHAAVLAIVRVATCPVKLTETMFGFEAAHTSVRVKLAEVTVVISTPTGN